ncbi:MAG: carbon monoxide dehydrogenase subunit G [Pseudorhodoplanes sp.]
MKIDGDFTIRAPLPKVWDALLDPQIVGPCVPGCSAIEVISPTDYRATVTLEIGPIKAGFKVAVTVTEIVPQVSVTCLTKGEEGSRASVLSASSVMTVKALSEDETQVHYSSDVSVTGRLGKFGLGLMKKKAESVASVFARNLQSRLQAVPAAS